MKEFQALGKNVGASRNLEWFSVGEEHRLPKGRTALRVALTCAEFTCRCPVTNQPDWATIYIDYGATGRIVESKSVKLYMETFRDEPIFHEHLAMQVLRDFVEVLDPRWCNVTVIFNTRGGIVITAKASYTETPPCTISYDLVGGGTRLVHVTPEPGDPEGSVEHATPFPDSVEDMPF